MDIDQSTTARDWMHAAATRAKSASGVLATLPAKARDAALRAAAAAIREDAAGIEAANKLDLTAFDASGGSKAFRDRLALTPSRIEAMAQGLDDIAGLPDPLDRVLAEWTRPNGLRIRRIPQPLGVIGMIYESRPNVGADAAGLCLKAGNAVILRGGSDSFNSARAIHAAVAAGLRAAGVPEDAVQIPPTTDRAYVAAMLGAAGQIDLIIPRGGKSLVERVQAEALVPVLAHAEGLCHTYIHAAADPAMARAVLANAKMRRTGVCGATEVLLIDAEIAPSLLPLLVEDLRALGCDFRAGPRARAIVADLPPTEKGDFDREWLDAILTVAVVDDLEGALQHIRYHGSSHTDAIVTEDAEVAATFLNGVDSAVAMWNASTQFCDGGEFGFGAEIGIATGRMHARGPVGLEQLTTFRYLVLGSGQVRP